MDDEADVQMIEESKASFDDLPIEIFYKILSYLPIDDVITCMWINQQWSSIIDGYRILNLVITNDEHNLINKRWFQTNQLINCNQQVANSDFKTLISFGLDKFMLENLKAIYIAFEYDEDFFKVEYLNKFPKLKKVGFKNTYFQSFDESKNFVTLQLPNLEIFELICFDLNKNITLTAPKLRKVKLHFNTNRKIIFTDSSSIDLIECSSYKSLIKELKNLEYLFIKQLDSLDDEFRLSNFTKLKELNFNVKEGKESLFYRLQDQLNELDNDNPLKHQLKIYTFGINLEYLSFLKLNDYGTSINDQTIGIYDKNYSKLANSMPFITSLNFSSIEYSNNLTVDLLKFKLTNLTKLIINKSVRNLNQLIQLFKEHRIIELTFDSSLLEQNIFNRLPVDLCPFVQKFIIKNEPNELNFDFVTRFEDLKEISIDRNLSIDLIKSIINPFDELSFTFIFNDITYQLDKGMGEAEYELNYQNEEIDSFNTLNAVIERLLNAPSIDQSDSDQSMN